MGNINDVRAMSAPRQVEQLYEAVVAGKVRIVDGRFWVETPRRTPNSKGDRKRCDTAARVLINQGRIEVNEEGMVVVTR